jgi:hypothetical protein
VAVPPGAVDGGQVYARIGFIEGGMSPMWGFTLREANAP